MQEVSGISLCCCHEALFVNADTETLEITLPVELLERVRKLVAAGTFASEDEVILTAIHEATQWQQVPDGSHASLEAMVGELHTRITHVQQTEEPA